MRVCIAEEAPSIFDFTERGRKRATVNSAPSVAKGGLADLGEQKKN